MVFIMGKMINLNYPLAIIDVGSNSVRLMFTDGIKSDKKLITTKLASGFDKFFNLSLNSIITTVNAINLLKEDAISRGAKSVYVFATEAVRKAKNKDEFIKTVKDVCLLDVDVVSGDLEAKLAVMGALSNSTGVVIDIGGASSEIALSIDGDIKYNKSYKIGAVTLSELSKNTKFNSEIYLKDIFNEGEDYSLYTCKCIGGTACALACIDLKLKVYNPKLIHNHTISLTSLKQIKAMLYKMTALEISNNFAVPLSRAEIIYQGVSIIVKMLENYNINKIIVSESDNLEGYLKHIEGKKC